MKIMAAEVIDAVFGGRRAAYAYNGFQAAVLEKTKLLPFFLPFFRSFRVCRSFDSGKISELFVQLASSTSVISNVIYFIRAYFHRILLKNRKAASEKT